MIGLFKKSDKATDPVCLMKVGKDEKALKYDYRGKTFYFCSEGCRQQFQQNPQKYLS